VLADSINLAQPGNLYEHYSRFLGVVLETAAEFFSRPAMREMEEEDKLRAW
jgi:hypothetical protein